MLDLELVQGAVGKAQPEVHSPLFTAAAKANRIDDAWLRAVRRWTMFAWIFLSFGLTLGMIWAYEELGWGGYWAWDPVENASLMPWLAGTAMVMCDLLDHHTHEEVAVSPRAILKRQVARARDLGLAHRLDHPGEFRVRRFEFTAGHGHGLTNLSGLGGQVVNGLAEFSGLAAKLLGTCDELFHVGLDGPAVSGC